MKKNKGDKICLSILFIESIITTLLCILTNMDFKIFNINITDTQSNMLLILTVIYFFMLLGVLFWKEWAVCGMLSTRIFITIIMVISSKFNIIVLIYQIMLMIISVIILVKLTIVKLNYKDNYN